MESVNGICQAYAANESHGVKWTAVVIFAKAINGHYARMF
jgi:hypothetical protein